MLAARGDYGNARVLPILRISLALTTQLLQLRFLYSADDLAGFTGWRHSQHTESLLYSRFCADIS